MGLSVNTNLDAIAALQTLSSIQRQTSRTQRRIATGLRVSSPTDDPSTFAIAQGIRGDIAGFQSISNALALGTAAVNVALQGAQTISDTLNLIKGKIVAAQDPTQDRRALQNDIGSFVAQIDAVAAAAQFNGVSLIGGGAATQNILSSLVRHGATVSVASIPVSAEPLDSGSLGLAGLNVVDQEAQIAIGSNNVSDHDTLSLTVGGQNTTFEFVTSAADTRAASNIAVVIGSSVSGTVAALNAALSRQETSMSPLMAASPPRPHRRPPDRSPRRCSGHRRLRMPSASSSERSISPRPRSRASAPRPISCRTRRLSRKGSPMP